MNPKSARRLRIFASVVGVLLLIVAAGGAWFYSRVRASLPQLEGAARLPALSSPVAIERDQLGVPTIRGANPLDVSRTLGWLHAQDRFFQMDTLRRRGAGELAELFGKAALPMDRATRVHDFRSLARTILRQLPAAQLSRLDAYTAGVNAGLAALKSVPFEYLVLRMKPQPWLPEDSLLVGYAMMLDLQGENGAYERSLMTLRDKLGPEAVAFFAPLATPADAALDDSRSPLPPIPSAALLDLRRQTGAVLQTSRSDSLHAGSNSMALAGSRSANGAALLANDMHLNLGLPNVWYRASLEWPGHKITGVTLPGVPGVIVGSNGHVAWGFTNANVDTSDLVVVEVNSISSQLYSVPNRTESLPFENRKTTIAVKGEPPVEISYLWTMWGPIVGTNAENRPLALRWSAHDVAALNFSLSDLEDATNVREAIAVAHRAGIPAQNFVVADARGEIAWTIAGRVPKRVGWDGRLPVSWTFGDRRWDGFRLPGEIPVDYAATRGTIWTANQRLVGGNALSALGDGGYDRPARAAQIRDQLLPLKEATPKDLLAIQLDDRALFLERWQKLLLGALTPESIAQKKARRDLAEAVTKWEGRAAVDSVSYRLVRSFRTAVAQRVFAPIFERCVEAYPDFNWSKFQYEDALWALVREKPAHLLSGNYRDWNALLLAAADDVLASLDRDNVSPSRATWGRRNSLQLWHPFSYALPRFLTGWLNAPSVPLPGGNDMPRVQSRDHGATERFVVSPGHEAEGIFHMPGGQSGHPLSPYYLAGHEAWVRGEATPFLPGKAEHTLMLTAE